MSSMVFEKVEILTRAEGIVVRVQVWIGCKLEVGVRLEEGGVK